MRERLTTGVNYDEVAAFQEKNVFKLKPEQLRKEMEQFAFSSFLFASIYLSIYIPTYQSIYLIVLYIIPTLPSSLHSLFTHSPIHSFSFSIFFLSLSLLTSSPPPLPLLPFPGSLPHTPMVSTKKQLSVRSAEDVGDLRIKDVRDAKQSITVQLNVREMIGMCISWNALE